MNKKNKAKYKIVEGKVRQFDLADETTVCRECGSLMRIFKSGFYEEAECMGCGATEVTKHYIN